MLRFSAHLRVSIALPSVFSDRSKSTQQRTIVANSGCRREISLALVDRLAPLISRRWPRLAAMSSMASTIREAPPVSATMPSALRSSLISSVGSTETNQKNPSASSSAPPAQSAIVSRTRRRSSRGGPWPHGHTTADDHRCWTRLWACSPSGSTIEHDPEQWEPLFREIRPARMAITSRTGPGRGRRLLNGCERPVHGGPGRRRRPPAQSGRPGRPPPHSRRSRSKTCRTRP